MRGVRVNALPSMKPCQAADVYLGASCNLLLTKGICFRLDQSSDKGQAFIANLTTLSRKKRQQFSSFKSLPCLSALHAHGFHDLLASGACFWVLASSMCRLFWRFGFGNGLIASSTDPTHMKLYGTDGNICLCHLFLFWWRRLNEASSSHNV